MDLPDTKRKYTKDEKRQLLANLDIEVEHKIRQFEAWLTDALENFRIHQEGHISRVPKVVRNLTMREFGDKYNGDVQAALMGLQKERMATEAGDVEMDKSMRKRKWVASVEKEVGGEGSRSFKNARMMSASPKKKPGSSTGPGTAQRARLLAANRTPGTSRTMGRVPPSPSPSKPPRPSPTKTPHPPPSSPSAANPKQPRPTAPPSSSTFNPFLPKTPGYPSSHDTHTHPNGHTYPNPNTYTNGLAPPTTARIPRRHENMLSVNGSPLANPYELGLEWFAEGGDSEPEAGDDDDPGNAGDGGGEGAGRGRRKSIIVRRDPSFSFQAPIPNPHTGLQRTASHSTLFAPPSSQPKPTHHTTPFPPSLARITLPTTDGHLLEFDPLRTSPGALDALEGISDSAKKHAREEMGRLVSAAVQKWSLG